MPKKYAFNLFIGDKFTHKGIEYRVNRNRSNSRINPRPMPKGEQAVTIIAGKANNVQVVLVFDCRDQIEVKR